MVTVLYADNDGIYSPKSFARYQSLPPGTGVKLGSQQLKHDEGGVTSFYKNLINAQILDLPVVADTKMFDTPNTLYWTSRNMTLEGVNGFTVAAESGLNGLKAVVKGRDDGYASMPAEERPEKKPIIFGVPVLSSRNDEDCCDGGVVQGAWHRETARLIRKSQKSGLDGVVCSDLYAIVFTRRVWPEAVILATSIRPPWATWIKDDDQRHSILPSDIVKYKVEYVVAGRAVSHAPDPLAALDRFCTECGQTA